MFPPSRAKYQRGITASNQYNCKTCTDEETAIGCAYLGSSKQPRNLQSDRSAHLVRPDESETSGDDGDDGADITRCIDVSSLAEGSVGVDETLGSTRVS